MTYKIRIRHKIPNKVFPLTLRYDDPSLNLPVIRVNLSDTFQVVELTGWEVIRGFIDPSKVKIEGVVNEGGQVYVVGNVNFTSVVETIEQSVDITGKVRYEVDVEEIPVDITGSVRYVIDLEEVPVEITGSVRNEIGVEITGTVRNEVPVEITGVVKEEYSYLYRIALQNTSITPTITWYGDEQCTQVISGPGPDAFLFTDVSDVWAVIEGDGLISETVHFIPSTPSISIRLRKAQYNYSITVTPENASSIATFKWYEDEGLTTLISGETSNTLTTSLEYVWVKVTAQDYKDVVVSFDGEVSEQSSIEMEADVNVVLSAIPLVQYSNTYPNYIRTGGENAAFILAVTNDKNRQMNYNVNIQNTNSLSSLPSSQNQDYLLRSNQIDLSNGWSIFVILRPGYKGGYLNTTTGKFTISSDYSDDVTFDVKGEYGSQHVSNIRYHNDGFGLYSVVHVIPYSTKNINMNIELFGVDDAAAEIDGTTLKYYDTGTYSNDTPTIIKNFVCNNKYTYYLQNVGSKTLAFDSDDMIPLDKMSIDIGRKESYFKYTIVPNTSDNLRVGFAKLVSNESSTRPNSNTSNDEYLDTIIQESENIRLILSDVCETYALSSNSKIIGTIDLSKHGTAYEFPMNNTRKEFAIWFLTSNINSNIIVTSLANGLETTTADYGTRRRYKFNTDTEKDGTVYHDGFRIQII